MKIIFIFLVLTFGQSLSDVNWGFQNYSGPRDNFKYSFNLKFGNLTWLNNRSYFGRYETIEVYLNRTITTLMVRFQEDPVHYFLYPQTGYIQTSTTQNKHNSAQQQNQHV